MRRLLALASLLLAPAIAWAQTPTTFAFALDPTHAAATFQVETASLIVVPCASVQVLPTERRCTASLNRITASSARLRAVGSDGAVSAWSGVVAVPAGTAPGPFTITGVRGGSAVAVAFVADYENSVEGPGTLTLTGVDASGADYLICGITWRDNTVVTVASVTHNGNALTPVTSKLTQNGGAIQVWRQIAPSGSGNLVITMSAAPASIQAGCSLFLGVDSGTPEGTIVTSQSGSAASTTTGAATGSTSGAFFDVVYTRGETTLTAGGTQTRRSAQVASGSIAHGTSTAPGAAADTLDWTFGGGVGYAHIVVPILPAAGAGSAPAVDGWKPHDEIPVRRRRPVAAWAQFLGYTPQHFAAPAAPALSWHPTFPDRVWPKRSLHAARQPFVGRDKFTAPAAVAVAPLSWHPVFPDRVFRKRVVGPHRMPFRSALSPVAHTFVTVTPPPATTFAEWLAEIATDRTILCALQPAEALSGFAAVGGGTPNTYSCAWATLIDTSRLPGGVYRRLDEVRINGASLALRASVALVDANLGSYFYNETTSTLYVSTQTGSDPDTFAAVAAYFSLFVATSPKDFVGGQLWEPRLTGSLPTVSATAEDFFTPGKTVADGTITLVNTGAPFDVWAKRYLWKHKKATLFLGGGALTEDQYERIAVLRIESIAVRDDDAVLTVRSMATALEQTVPLHTIGSEEYARLGDGVEGTYKPLLYGLVRNIPAPCVNAYIKANPDPATWPETGFADVYLVADEEVQVLTSVLSVIAVNRSSGEVRTLDPSLYTANLSACTVTVTDQTASSHEWEIRIDATGETDGAGGYLDTFGEIARDLLMVLGEPASAIETSTFTAADASAPFPLGLWIRDPQSGAEVFSRLQQSVLGGLWIDRAGKWRAYVLDAATEPAAVATLEDPDFATWQQVDRIDPIYPVVRVYYAQNQATGDWPVRTASDDATQYLNETTDGLSVYTALVSSSDAAIIAQRYRLLASAPDTWIDTDQRGLALMTAELFDRVTVTRARAPHVSGAYSSQRMEILGYEKRLDPAGLRVRLGDISGIADLIDYIRAWAGPAVADYASSSAAEREANAYWHDADGSLPSGPSNHSVWW